MIQPVPALPIQLSSASVGQAAPLGAAPGKSFGEIAQELFGQVTKEPAAPTGGQLPGRMGQPLTTIVGKPFVKAVGYSRTPTVEQPAGQTSAKTTATTMGSLFGKTAPEAPTTTSEPVHSGKTSKKEAKEKDSNRPKAADDPSPAVAFLPVQQTDDPRSLLLSFERPVSNQGDAPAAEESKTAPAIEGQVPAAAFEKAPVAFEVKIPKAAVKTQPPTSTPRVNPLPATKAPAPVANVAPIERSTFRSDRNTNGKQQPADTYEPVASAAPVAKSISSEAMVQGPTAVPHVIDVAAAPVGVQRELPAAYTAPESKPVATARTAQAAALADPPTITTPRTHSIDLKVPAGEDNSKVDVRISQRAGDVQVTVRTADGNLAQSLRQHLPELSDRLAQNGVSSDIWHPSAAQTSADTNSSNNSDSRGFEDSNPQQQSRHSDDRSRQNQQDDGRQPAWQQELTSAEQEAL